MPGVNNHQCGEVQNFMQITRCTLTQISKTNRAMFMFIVTNHTGILVQCKTLPATFRYDRLDKRDINFINYSGRNNVRSSVMTGQVRVMTGQKTL